MRMKRIYTAILALISATALNAQDAVTLDNGVTVRNASITRDAKGLHVDMDLDFSGIKVRSNRAVTVNPRIINGADTLDCSSVIVYGRRRYFYYVRNNRPLATSRKDQSFRKKELPDTLSYTDVVDYSGWMNGASLFINEKEIGCCNKVIRENLNGALAQYKVPDPIIFTPAFIYIPPVPEKKTFSLSATSYIDFPVSQTVIYPEYRRNIIELGKIIATIDSVRTDADVTIDRIVLKGFASPESPYSNNERLAKGRVAALKNYVCKREHINPDIITTTYEPENWEGLRAFVVASSISNKQAILDIIDSDREPDNKEAFLKKSYPEEYRYLLKECYPALRKTDYAIEYTVRSYTSLDEIRKAFAANPEKLNLNEFYILAESYDIHSQEFDDVFRKAVDIFPNDIIANLNAATIAMKENRMKEAAIYLDRAGERHEAFYARGIYNALQGDYQRAANYFKAIADEMPEAAEALKTVEKILERQKLYID